MLLQISTLKFWINLEPSDYFHLIGTARGGRSQLASYAVRRARGKRMSRTWQDIIVKTSYRHHKPKVA